MVNRVTLIGHLGKDPEFNTVGETKVAKFSMATSETYKKDGETQQQTQWHNIVAWDKLADICKYIKKGSKIFLEGKIQYRKYQDKEGNDKYITEIRADVIKFLDKKEGASEASSASNEKSVASAPSKEEDELLF